MSEFKFKVKEYFILSDGQIGIAGDMNPDNFPTVTNNFILKLFSKNKVLHVFEVTGEEMFYRSSLSIKTRSFLTADNIRDILDSENVSDLYIIGIANNLIVDDR